MTTHYTKYFRFPVPDFMSEPWVTQLSATFDSIDAQMYGVMAVAGMMNWINSTSYAVGDIAIDSDLGTVWSCLVANNSAAAPTTFAQDRAAHPTYWGFGVITTGTAATISYANGTSGLSATNVQAAIDEVDARIDPVVPSNTPPLMNGPAVVGVSQTYARGDHGHPSDTSRASITYVDAQDATKAPIASPTFTGVPRAPTPALATNDTTIATTAFVAGSIGGSGMPVPGNANPIMDGPASAGISNLYSRQDHIHPSDTSKAPIASPTFTGSPLTTTPTPGDNSTRVASTAFVAAAVAPLATAASVPVVTTTMPAMDGTAAIGASGKWADGAHVHPTDTTRAPLASPTFTGTTNTAALTASGIMTASAGFQVMASGSLALNQNPGGGSTQSIAWYNSASQGVGRISLDYGNNNVQVVAGTTGNWTLDPAGNFTVSGKGWQPGGGSWGASSDARIKTVEADYTQGLDGVIALRPVVYTYKGNDTVERNGTSPHEGVAGKQFVGLIAQEVELVFPGMVTQTAGFIDGMPVDDLRQLDTTPLIFALVNAVKELNARLAAIEAV